MLKCQWAVCYFWIRSQVFKKTEREKVLSGNKICQYEIHVLYFAGSFHLGLLLCNEVVTDILPPFPYKRMRPILRSLVAVSSMLLIPYLYLYLYLRMAPGWILGAVLATTED